MGKKRALTQVRTTDFQFWRPVHYPVGYDFSTYFLHGNYEYHLFLSQKIPRDDSQSIPCQNYAE